MKNYFVLILAICLLYTSAVNSEETVFLCVLNLSGEVEVTKDGIIWEAAKINQVLNSNDKIRTKNGKVDLKFADGTIINLKENSSLDLVQVKCENAIQNSILKLWFGKLKAKVIKLKDSASFQVHSPKVVAAVKGTEFVMGTTFEETELIVFEGIVALYEITEEKEIIIKENEKATFRDGLLNNPKEMSPDEMKLLKEGWEVTLQMEKQSLQKVASLDSGIEKEIQELRRDLAEIKDRSNLENKQDLLERISDVQMGKVVVDKDGYRVKTENYIIRPAPDTIQLLNLTKREGGPNAGLSSFEINDTFNHNLPFNFMDVKKNLYKDSWFNQSNLPSYYLIKEVSVTRNPLGDNITDLVNLQTPIWNNSLGQWEQPFNETFTINSVTKWTHTLDTSFVEEYKNVNGVSTGTNLPYILTKQLTSDGGYLTTDTYSDGTYLKKYFYIVDDNGNVKNYNLSTLTSDLQKYNWELIFEATEFSGRKIDIIAIPQIFSHLY